MIDKYGEFLLPDLKQYGIDLRDVVLDVPPFSPRYVLAHIRNLNYDSAFIAEVRGGQQFRGWDKDRYLSAAQLDAIRILQYILILVNKEKKKKFDPPEPTPLPDDQAKKKRQDKPGSFGFMVKSISAKTRQRKEGGG